MSVVCSTQLHIATIAMVEVKLLDTELVKTYNIIIKFHLIGVLFAWIGVDVISHECRVFLRGMSVDYTMQCIVEENTY